MGDPSDRGGSRFERANKPSSVDRGEEERVVAGSVQEMFWAKVVGRKKKSRGHLPSSRGGGAVATPLPPKTGGRRRKW